jgi:hypothetical protein
MKFIPRAIFGFIVAFFISLFFIFNGLAPLSGFIFISVWILVIWVLSDKFLKNMALKDKLKLERKIEEDNWKRKSYFEERGRQKAQDIHTHEQKMKELEYRYPLGSPAFSRAVFGKRSRL